MDPDVQISMYNRNENCHEDRATPLLDNAVE
jgi:hypothetical protein